MAERCRGIIDGCVSCNGTAVKPNKVFLVYAENAVDPNDRFEYHAKDMKQAQELVGKDKWPKGVKIIIKEL